MVQNNNVELLFLQDLDGRIRIFVVNHFVVQPAELSLEQRCKREIVVNMQYAQKHIGPFSRSRPAGATNQILNNCSMSVDAYKLRLKMDSLKNGGAGDFHEDCMRLVQFANYLLHDDHRWNSTRNSALTVARRVNSA
jgi:hypothetical protein